MYPVTSSSTAVKLWMSLAVHLSFDQLPVTLQWQGGGSQVCHMFLEGSDVFMA